MSSVSPSALPQAWLELPDGHVVPVLRDCTIGRSPDNDVVLPVADVSRYHAKLHFRNNAHELTDLGSTNGSAVNGLAVKGTVPLADCDRLLIGGIPLRFRTVAGSDALQTRRSEAAGLPSAPAVLILAAKELAANGVAEWVRKDGGMTLAGRARTEKEALASLRTTKPTVLVIAESEELGVTVGFLANARATDENTRFVVLVERVQPVQIARYLEAHVSGCCLQSEGREEFAKAVHAAASGGTYLSRRVAALCAGKLFAAGGAHAEGPARLSPRELEVFRLVGLGKQNRDIAQELGMSVKTVEAHKENLKVKLELASSAELLRTAREWLGHAPAG